jgi:hypothetical protein
VRWVSDLFRREPLALQIIHHEDDWYRSAARLRGEWPHVTRGLLFLCGNTLSFEADATVLFTTDARKAAFGWPWNGGMKCSNRGAVATFDSVLGVGIDGGLWNSRRLRDEWRKVIEAAQADTPPTS